jgi:thymidylate kinase
MLMAKIFELAGCNGVGKSTIYENLSAKWNKNKAWIPADLLYPKPKVKFNSLNGFLIPFAKTILQKKLSVDQKILREAGDRFVNLYPLFMDAFWNIISSGEKKSMNGMDLRYEKISFLYTIIRRFQYLKELPNDKSVILDEGLLHQIGRLENAVVSEEEVVNLLDLMPLPDGVIHIQLDVEENARRLFTRNHITTMHKSLSLNQIINITRQSETRRKKMNNVLHSKGIHILCINGEKSIEENVNKIDSYLNEIIT